MHSKENYGCNSLNRTCHVTELSLMYFLQPLPTGPQGTLMDSSESRSQVRPCNFYRETSLGEVDLFKIVQQIPNSHKKFP